MEYIGHSFCEVVIHTCIEEFKNYTDIPLRKVFVGNLHEKTTCTDIRNYFSSYGCIEKCRMCNNKWRIPCAFVTFEKEEDTIRVLTDPKKKILHGQHLRVKPAEYSQQPEHLNQLILMNEETKIQNSSKNIYSFERLPNDIDKPSIHILNDICLDKILKLLPIVDKLRAESVCKRWKILSQESWYTMKILDFLTSTWGMSRKDIILIHPYGLRGVLLRCGKFLKKINMPLHSNISYCFKLDALPIIGELCPNITSIDVTAIMITPRGIDALANCRNLTTIVLRSWWTIEDMDISLRNLFKKVKKLKKFQISDAQFMGKCLCCLPNKTMHTLTLNSCQICNLYLSAALKRLVNLRELRITGCEFVCSNIISIINNRCTNLILLKLKYLYDVQMTGFNGTKLSNLEILSIRYNYHITDDLLLHVVENCPKLKQIDVQDSPITPETAQFIQEHYDIGVKCRYLDRRLDMDNHHQIFAP